MKMKNNEGYSISEISQIVGIPQSTIRYWDKKGLLPFGLRSDPGYRVFDELDINWLHFLNYLKDAGMTIEVMQQYVNLFVCGDTTLVERQKIVYDCLDKLNEQIEWLNSAKLYMEFKCWLYDKAIEIGSFDAVPNVPPEEIPDHIKEALDKLGGFQQTRLNELIQRQKKKNK